MAVVVLGRSLLDYLPQARQPSSTLGTTPGLAAGKTVPCETCGSRGRVSERGNPCAACSPLIGSRSPARNDGGGHGCKPCLVCLGWGWRRARAGDSAWDEYARVEIASGDVGEGTEGDDLERRLQQTTRLLASWEKPETVAFAWEERRKTQFASGDYDNLVAALGKLEVSHPGRHRTWWSVNVVQDGKTIGPALQVRLDETTEMIAALMPKRPIRVPRWLRPEGTNEDRKTSLWRGKAPAHETQRNARDEEILSLREKGWKIARIARYHSLTERHVKRILASAPVASAP